MGSVATGRASVSLPNGQTVGVEPYRPQSASGVTTFNKILDGAFSTPSDDVGAEIDRFKTETSLRKAGSANIPPNASSSDGMKAAYDLLDTVSPKNELSELDTQRMNLLTQAFPNIPQRELANYSDLPPAMRSVALGFAVARTLRGDTTGSLEALVAPFQVQQAHMDEQRANQIQNIQQQAAMAQERLREIGVREDYLYKDILTKDSQLSSFVLGLKDLQEKGRQFDSSYVLQSMMTNHQISQDQFTQLSQIFTSHPGDPKARVADLQSWLALNQGAIDPKLGAILLPSAAYDTTADAIYRNTLEQSNLNTKLLTHQEVEATLNESFNRVTFDKRVAGFIGTMNVQVAEGNRAADKIDAEIKHILSQANAANAAAGKDNAQAGLFRAQTVKEGIETAINQDWREANRRALDVTQRIQALDPTDPDYKTKSEALNKELAVAKNQMDMATGQLQGFQGAWAKAAGSGDQSKINDFLFQQLLGRATTTQDEVKKKELNAEVWLNSLGSTLSPLLKGGYSKETAENAQLDESKLNGLPGGIIYWSAPGSTEVKAYTGEQVKNLVEQLHSYAKAYKLAGEASAKAEAATGSVIQEFKGWMQPQQAAPGGNPAPTMKPTSFTPPASAKYPGTTRQVRDQATQIGDSYVGQFGGRFEQDSGPRQMRSGAGSKEGTVTHHYGGFAIDYYYEPGKRIGVIDHALKDPRVGLVIDYVGNKSYRRGQDGKWTEHHYPGGDYGHIHIEPIGSYAAAKEFQGGRAAKKAAPKKVASQTAV